VSFNTGASDAYSSWIIESAGKALDTYLDSLGYEGAAGLDGHSHPAYTHKDWTGRYRADWLADFQDSVPLSKISMPGTHDTMSFYGGDAVQTQSMSLRTQLMSGIRALDIRCRHIENRFAIHHGFVYQNANFDDVLQATQEFLSKHPTETIIMRVKEEYNPTGNTRTFASTFKYYLDMYPACFGRTT
jgi:1-phosphatidylinositol phosphodiesterase